MKYKVYFLQYCVLKLDASPNKTCISVSLNYLYIISVLFLQSNNIKQIDTTSQQEIGYRSKSRYTTVNRNLFPVTVLLSLILRPTLLSQCTQQLPLYILLPMYMILIVTCFFFTILATNNFGHVFTEEEL